MVYHRGFHPEKKQALFPAVNASRRIIVRSTYLSVGGLVSALNGSVSRSKAGGKRKGDGKSGRKLRSLVCRRHERSGRLSVPTTVMRTVIFNWRSALRRETLFRRRRT